MLSIGEARFASPFFYFRYCFFFFFDCASSPPRILGLNFLTICMVSLEARHIENFDQAEMSNSPGFQTKFCIL